MSSLLPIQNLPKLFDRFLRGRDIKRYEHSFADLWLINTHNGIKSKNIPPINIEDYPAIKDHLDNFYSKLEKRADKGDTPITFATVFIWTIFLSKKIIYPKPLKVHTLF